MTNNKRLAYMLTCILAWFLAACEKPLVEDDHEKVAEPDGITLIFEARTAEPYGELGEASPAYTIKSVPERISGRLGVLFRVEVMV